MIKVLIIGLTPRIGGVVGGCPAQSSTTTIDRCTYSGTLNANEKGGNYGGITYIEFLQSDTRTAAIAFERVYERCGDYANEDNRRANNAERAYNHFH